MKIPILIFTYFNLRIWALPVPNGQWIDLSYPYDNNTLSYAPLRYRVLWRQVLEWKGNKFKFGEVCIGEHIGTHVDAPKHFYFNSSDISTIPLESLQGPAVVVDITQKAQTDPDALLTREDLENWERQYGRIPDGSIVLMNSGWGHYADNATAYFGNPNRGLNGAHFPGFSEDAIKFLLEERSINGIGVDTISLDHGISENFPVHYALLGVTKYGLEVVANLDKLPPVGAHIYILPMKVEGAGGAPARILAHVPNNI